MNNAGRLILSVVAIFTVCLSLTNLSENGTFILTIIATGIIVFAIYIDCEHRRIEQIVKALKSIDLVREDTVRPPIPSISGWLPNGLTQGTELANLTLPFTQPSVLSAYTFSFHLMGWIRSAVTLSKEESEIVAHWRKIPHKITWQRWHGGYYRVQLELIDQGSRETSIREFGSYDGAIAMTLWTEQLGELNTSGMTLEARIFLDISPAFIRIYLSGGRFGYSDDYELGYKLNRPPKGGLILEVPLTEPELMPFDVRTKQQAENEMEHRTKPLMWEPEDGRPPLLYKFEDESRGTSWHLCYHFDRRPLFTGRIEEIVPSKSGRNEDESILVSFTSDSYVNPRYLWVRPRHLAQPSYKSKGLSVEDNVYIAFKKDGTVDHLIHEDEVFTPLGRLKSAQHGNEGSIR